MKNATKIIDSIVQTIEVKNLYSNPGPAAKSAGVEIDDSYIVIPRSDLPKITFGYLGDGGTPQLTHINANASKGNTSVMREIAYEYLAMADYLDGKKAEGETLKLRTAQWEAYSTIYPHQNMYEFETFDYKDNTQVNIQRAIDEIVKLRAQLDKK